MNCNANKVEVGHALLSHPQERWQRGEWLVVAESINGDVIWEFNIKQTGRYIDGNFYSYRLVSDYIYLIVSDEPRYKPHPTQKQTVVANPTRWTCLSLDVATGKVVQEISLGNEPLDECRIEDVDDQGLLIGKSSQELMYFRRMHSRNST